MGMGDGTGAAGEGTEWDSTGTVREKRMDGFSREKAAGDGGG